MDSNIIGHITGLTDLSKQFFHTLFDKSHLSKLINVIDVDLITSKIVEDTNMCILFNKYEYYSKRIKDESLSQNDVKISTSKFKQLEKKMNQYWKVKMEYYLNKLSVSSTSPKKKVLLIGLLSSYKNHKININLNITPKFFVKVDYTENAKSIIKYNLESSKNEIIDGSFDLNYLDINFLIKKRMQLQAIYTKMNYVVMSIPSIINTIELFTQSNVPDILYYASFVKYTKKIPIMTNIIYAYSQEWITLSSILLSLTEINKIQDVNTNVEKGIKYNKQYIKLTKDQAKKMDGIGYIYEISDTTSFLPYPTKNNIYKYFTVQPIKVSRVIEIKNIIDQLKQLGVNIIII